MALKIVWTSKAEAGLEKVIEYLDVNWTVTEILNLEKNLEAFLGRISKYPRICPKTSMHENLHKGLVDKNNYIVYRVNYTKGIIEIIYFRGTRQEPLD